MLITRYNDSDKVSDEGGCHLGEWRGRLVENFGRHQHGWDSLKQMQQSDEPADVDKWQAVVNKVMSLWVP